MPYGSISVDQINNTTGYSLGAGNASLMKNRIINGAMIISQRNGTTATSQTNGSYSLDRWYSLSYDGNVTTGKYTVTQSATAPAGFTKSLLVTSSAATSSGSSDIYTVGQAIEGYNIADLGWGTANAKTVTLSFWVRSSVTGTFGVFIRNASLDYSYPTTYTISAADTWEQKSITIPAPTSGTWPTDNSAGLYVWFQLQVGSSLVATPNTWTSSGVYGASGCVNFLNTNGATIYFTGVQLEVGSVATGYEYRHYGQELALCQRYLPCFVLNGSGGNNVAVGTNYQSGLFITSMPLPVQARVAPTGLVYTGTISNSTVYSNNSGVTATGIVWNGGTTSTASFNVTSGATTVGSGALWSSSGTATIYFTGCEL